MKKRSRAVGRAARGFTLVELVIVMAVMAILAATVVSFSALMKGYAANSEQQFSFLTECSTLKASVTEWVAEKDAAGAEFTVHTDGSLSVTKDGETSTLRFSGGWLREDGQKSEELTLIEGASFTVKGKLIRCDMYRIHENGRREDKSFVFSLRAATFVEEAADE